MARQGRMALGMPSRPPQHNDVVGLTDCIARDLLNKRLLALKNILKNVFHLEATIRFGQKKEGIRHG